MQLHTLILMAPADGTSSSGSGYTTIIFFLLFFVILYFFMIRPQAKKAKDQKNFVNEIKPGDKVVTIGGVHGKVLKVDDDTYLIEVDNNVKIRIEKTVISMDYTKAMLSRKNGQS